MCRLCNITWHTAGFSWWKFLWSGQGTRCLVSRYNAARTTCDVKNQMCTLVDSIWKQLLCTEITAECVSLTLLLQVGAAANSETDHLSKWNNIFFHIILMYPRVFSLQFLFNLWLLCPNDRRHWIYLACEHPVSAQDVRNRQQNIKGNALHT